MWHDDTILLSYFLHIELLSTPSSSLGSIKWNGGSRGASIIMVLVIGNAWVIGCDGMPWRCMQGDKVEQARLGLMESEQMVG